MEVTAKGESISRRVFDSGLWMIASQWTTRLVGFVSTIILARLLTPGDYGIVAMGALVVSFLEIVTVLGGEKYLISKAAVDSDDLDTAWTIRFLQLAAIALVLWVTAPLVVSFFKEPALRPVMKTFSLGVLITALENIGMVNLRRELSFDKIFWYATIQKMAGFVVTVALAFAFRNYWAMVIGFLVLRLVGTALSYSMVDYRPSFCLRKVKQQWSFSQWMLVSNLAVYLRNKCDQVIVSKYFGANNIGTYSMASHISSLPTTELTTPVFQAIFPGLSKLVGRPEELERVYIKILGALACIIIPLSIGLASVAESAVEVMLGNKWASAVPIIQALSLMAIPLAFHLAAIDYLTLHDRIKTVSIIDWINALLLVPQLALIAACGGIQQVATTRAIYAFVAALIYHYVIKVQIGLNVRQALSAVIRPLLSALAMAGWLRLVKIETGIALIDLVLQIVQGAGVYLVAMFFQWSWMGRPDSGEKLLFDKICEKIFSARVAAD